MFFNQRFTLDQIGDTVSKLSPKNLHIAKVVLSGGPNKLPNLSNDKATQERTRRFNADEHAIKCVIFGSQYDGSGEIPDEYLPNCFPILPKHLNLVPGKEELVLIMTSSDDDKFGDRFYIGPIISSNTKLDKDVSTSALANFQEGLTTPTEEISKVPQARGIYENPQNVVIEGRSNTDIIQRPSEVLIRSGKFEVNNPLKFNSTNPAFVQIKSNFSYSEPVETGPPSPAKDISVTNIVSDKINLLTHNGLPLSNNILTGGLTKVNKETGVAEYIDDESLQEILSNAQPLVFGDTLLKYLKLMKNALLNHVHNKLGSEIPSDRSDLDIKGIADFKRDAENLEKTMLSKNIRIN